ncbi:MAG: DUF4250 domain-containing protein [Opitutales bacterium]
MTFDNYRKTDPRLLVGLVNTELRNHSVDLDDLCRTHEIDPDLLQARLAEAGYHYRPEQKAFR